MSMLDPNNIRNKNEFEEMKNQVKESMEKLESYPYNAEFFYTTSLCRVNLDAKRQESIAKGKGFIISRPQSSTKKDMKDPESIFSYKFGQTLGDVNPFGNRYKCDCGLLTKKINAGLTCPQCGSKVRYVDDDFEYFGWMVLSDPYYIFHPNLFKSLQAFIGKDTIENIINPVDAKDIDGHTISNKGKKDEPFFGIGILGFYERFDEIMEYYKNKGKKEYYNDIMDNRENIFTQSIPVYTSLLRPLKVDGKKFHFEETNATYNMMAKLVSYINNTKLSINKKKKPKNQLLYDLHTKYMELYEKIEAILAGKKGTIRSLFGGRYNFSARSVIVPDASLRIDEIKLSYYGMVELMQQTIINVLQKSYNMTYNDAYNEWYRAQLEPNEKMIQIIKGLIKDSPRGIPVLINRN